MENLRQYGVVPISPEVLREGLSEYRSVKDKISALERTGQLVRIRNGMYVVSNEITGQELSLELIANRLYGPSYVSFETALSYYGLIPERVYVTRSAVLKRGKSYDTPLGQFEYIRVPDAYYPIRQRIVQNEDRYAFVMATPEKAICDQIIGTRGLRLQSLKAMREYLLEDLRLDIEYRENWDLDIIVQCIEHGYKRNELQFLYNFLSNG